MQERTFDEFDEFAADYRSIHNRNIQLSGADSFYFAEMKVKLLRKTAENAVKKVLDIGCGDGATEQFMQQYFPAWQVKAIDISAKSIEQAKQKNIPNTQFETYDGKIIPASDQEFDIVFIAGVLHHIDFSLHAGLIKEINRVLKKGGRLYLFEHNPLNPLTRYLVKTCVFDKEARLLKHGYTKKILKAAELQIKSNDFIIFFPRKGFFARLIGCEKYLSNIPFGGQYFIRAEKP